MCSVLANKCSLGDLRQSLSFRGWVGLGVKPNYKGGRFCVVLCCDTINRVTGIILLHLSIKHHDFAKGGHKF